MAGIKNIGISFALIGIFVLAMVSFMVNFSYENATPISLANDTTLSNFTRDINSSLNLYPSEVNASDAQFTADIPSAGIFGLIFTSVGSIWKTLVTTPKAIYNLVLQFSFNELFGGGQFLIVFNILSALATVIIIFYAWKWIRGGDPD